MSRVRFEHEARTISRLDHPNICTLYDVGDTGGMPFLVMQLIEGQTLADATAGGRLPAADVLRIGADLASALTYAHRSGVLHRDIKPGNVMLLPEGRAILLDFGIAKAAAPSAEAATTEALVAPLTMAGGVLGTVEYMSPEQLGGGALDPRSDIFSLGLVLYELAAGRHPFRRQTVPLTASAILTAPYPHLTTPGVPPSLDRVLEKMLATAPSARYATMADCLADLGAVQHEAPVVAPRRLSRGLIVGAATLAVVPALIAVAMLTSDSRDAAPVSPVTPTAPSVPVPPTARVSYWLDVEPPTGTGRPAAQFASLGDQTFPRGSRFRVNVQAPAEGYVYLVGDEGAGPQNPTGLALLFRGPSPATTGWYRFAGSAATERPWLVWSGRPRGELEILAPLLNPRDQGLVQNPQVASAVRALLSGAARSSETRDTAAVRATLASTGDLVVHRLELHHD